MIDKIVSDIIDSNVFVVSDESSCVIFDAGAKIEEVKKIVGEKNVEAVFLTHGHYDHCFRLQDYINEFKCKVYCSEFAKEYLQDGKKNYSEGHLIFNDFQNFVFLKGCGQLSFENFQINFYQLGGHSKSDMCYVVGDDIFVGDVLIGRDIGRMDLYGGSKQEMQKSLKFLNDLPYKTIHSGHGDDNNKQNQNKVIKLWLKFLNR